MKKDQIIKAINLPLWKQDFIRKNRLLYKNNSGFVDNWLSRWKVLEKDKDGNPRIPVEVERKYEWQADQLAGRTGRTSCSSGHPHPSQEGRLLPCVGGNGPDPCSWLEEEAHHSKGVCENTGLRR